MSVDTKDITGLSRLAKLALLPDELTQVTADLDRIIAMVDALAEVDTDGVAPLAHPLDAVQRMRPDAVTEEVDRDHFQGIAPATQDGLYLVPRVVE